MKRKSLKRCYPPKKIIKIINITGDTKKTSKRGKMKNEKYKKKAL